MHKKYVISHRMGIQFGLSPDPTWGGGAVQPQAVNVNGWKKLQMSWSIFGATRNVHGSILCVFVEGW